MCSFEAPYVNKIELRRTRQKIVCGTNILSPNFAEWSLWKMENTIDQDILNGMFAQQTKINEYPSTIIKCSVKIVSRSQNLHLFTPTRQPFIM